MHPLGPLSLIHPGCVHSHQTCPINKAREGGKGKHFTCLALEESYFHKGKVFNPPPHTRMASQGTKRTGRCDFFKKGGKSGSRKLQTNQLDINTWKDPGKNIIKQQICEHLENNKVITRSQHGFVMNRSGQILLPSLIKLLN